MKGATASGGSAASLGGRRAPFLFMLSALVGFWLFKLMVAGAGMKVIGGPTPPGSVPVSGGTGRRRRPAFLRLRLSLAWRRVVRRMER